MKTQNSTPIRNVPKVSFTDTFQSSEDQRQHIFSIQPSLARGINENNSSLIVQQETFRGSGEIEQSNLDQQTSKIVINYRSKYDRIKTQNNELEEKIKKMKSQIELLKEKESKLTESNHNTSENCRLTQQQLENQVVSLEEGQLRLDANRNMEERLKKDIIYYKKNVFDLNLELQKRKNEARRMANSSQREKKLSLRCRTLLSSVQRTVNKNGYERQRGMVDFDRAIVKRQENAQRERERQHRLSLSMQEALTMKLPEETELCKVLKANKLLKCMLHCKMQVLMEQYKEVRTSFTKIKQHTTIKTADQFVLNYLNKDLNYGELLEKISRLQPQIEALKEEKGKLKEDQRHLEYQEDQLEEQLRLFRSKIEVDLASKLQNLNTRLQQHEKYKNGLNSWAVNFIAMIRGTTKSKVKSQKQSLSQLVKTALSALVETFENEGQRSRSISEEVLDRQSVSTGLDAKQMIRRNIRIKTVGVESHVYAEQDLQSDGKTEMQFLLMSRRAVKKRLHKAKAMKL